MIEVKLYGTIRLSTGLKKTNVDAETVNDIYPVLLKEIKALKPDSNISIKDLKNCVVMVNNKKLVIELD